MRTKLENNCLNSNITIYLFLIYLFLTYSVLLKIANLGTNKKLNFNKKIRGLMVTYLLSHQL